MYDLGVETLQIAYIIFFAILLKTKYIKAGNKNVISNHVYLTTQTE